MDVSKLEGADLDAEVAKAEGLAFVIDETKDEIYGDVTRWVMAAVDRNPFNPSTDWSQGGQIIERERIELLRGNEEWHAVAPIFKEAAGPTALIAAMRAYVASKQSENPPARPYGELIPETERHFGFVRTMLRDRRSVEIDMDRKLVTRVWDGQGNVVAYRLTRADYEVLAMQHRNRFYLELTQEVGSQPDDPMAASIRRQIEGGGYPRTD